MRKLKQNQLGPFCSFCDNDKKRAIYVARGFRVFSCEDHKDNLLKQELLDEKEDYTEADYQTWLRI